MGAGASAIDGAKGADASAISAGVQSQSAADKFLLKAALEARLGGAEILKNFEAVVTNQADLNELRLAVFSNKEGVYEARSMIEENRTMIMRNYSSAFVGNRQIANQNTDDIFKNRFAILDGMKVDGQVQMNFRKSKHNEAVIEFLENRSLLNNRVAKVNEQMSDVNADLIAINKAIIDSNEEIVSFNSDQIATNTNLLAGIKLEKATPEANSARIASNKEKIAKIKTKNEEYNQGMVDKHKLIVDNRKQIETNAAEIKERRDAILANRDIIKANGAKIGEMLRAQSAGVDELVDKLGALSDDEVKSMQAALVAGTEEENVETNRKAISENEARLHSLHLEIMTNKEDLYSIRAMIEENRALIVKNYAAAFVGNRQMANQNTDDIFKNRCAILDAVKVDGQVQENWRNSKYNEANADFLEHRSKLNNRVAKVNEMMSKANEKLIGVNSSIMKSNAEIVDFNSQQIETNSKLLGGIVEEKANPEANAARIAKNAERIQVIADRVAKYGEKSQEMKNKVMANRQDVEANAQDIEARRARIEANRSTLVQNGAKVAAMLMGGEAPAEAAAPAEREETLADKGHCAGAAFFEPAQEAPAAIVEAAAAADAAEPEEDEVDKKLKPAFADIDKDNSGFIEASELKSVLATMGISMTDEEIDGVLKMADVNGDHKLDYAEYKKLVTKAM